MLEQNVAAMDGSAGFDVVIVCTSTPAQAEYWQKRLEAVRGAILPLNSIVLAVDEDWSDGGAGNALGTFYAYQKACAVAKRKGAAYVPRGSTETATSVELLSQTTSVAIYHTAGKGTRLAPLPGSENNNKPGVKIPALVDTKEGSRCLTILESVIKQTGLYADCRKGRLSVFWGDQVFVPSVPVEYKPVHHADILCSLGPMPSEKEWEEKGMHKYGLIAVNGKGAAAQVEKVTYGTATKLLKSLGKVESVGTSLGSFSISLEILTIFLTGFATELSQKAGKFDTDPHLWMPLTLDKDAYAQLMEQKEVSADESNAHWDRMRAMISTLQGDKSRFKGLFGAVDVGQDTYWWDYGQLRLYQMNTLRMRDSDVEADLMRQFYGVTLGVDLNSTLRKVTVDAASTVTACLIHEGSVKASTLCKVTAKSIDAEEAVLVNVTVGGKIVAPKGTIIYNVTQSGDLILSPKDVLAGVYMPSRPLLRMSSTSDTDGGKVWKKAVCGNALSFEAVYKQNMDVDVTEAEALAQKHHDETKRTVVGAGGLFGSSTPLVVASAVVLLAAVSFAAFRAGLFRR